MVDRYGAYGFNWREWGWFTTLFFSFLAQTVLVFYAYKKFRAMISFNLHRTNRIGHELRFDYLIPLSEKLEEIEKKQRGRKTWLSK